MQLIAIKDKTLKVVINIGVYLIIFVVIHFVARTFVFKPLNKEIKLANEMQTKEDEMLELREKFPNPKKKIKEIQEKMAELDRKSTTDEDLPEIIKHLTEKSSELKIEIISIKPSKDVSFTDIDLPRGVSKSYIEMILKAQYKVLGEYLQALVDLPIIFTIEELTIEKPKGIEDDALLAERESSENKIIAKLLISSYTMW